MAEVKYLDNNGLATVWSKVKGIVTPKADKVSGATAGHLAGLNSSGNLTDSGLAADNVAQKNGSYSGMTVGAAEDLVSAESVASEFTSRITGGSTAVGKGGTAIVDRIKGRTLVYNQLVYNGNFKAQSSWGNPVGGTVSYVQDGISIAFATKNTYTGQTGRVIVSGHKYYMSAVYNQPSNTATNIVLRDSTAGTGNFITINSTSYGSFIRVEQIGTAVTTGNHEIRIINSYDGANTTVVKYIELIDLTQMFGFGNEPATTAEFDALYPLPYYEYTLGKLVNNGVQTERDLLWNQLVSNGNFSNGTTGWSAYNSTLSAASGELTITKSSTASGLGGLARTALTGDTSHWYYIACDAKSDSANTEMYFGFHTTSNTIGSNIMVANGTSTYRRISIITRPANATDSLCARIGVGASAVGVSGKIRNVIMCDLTAMFGAGNEPSSTTEFEDMFPNPYYPYDTGTEQHFSFPQFKTGIRTVGFNQWDEEVEEGSFDQYGVPVSGGARLRAKNFIEVFPNTDYYVCMTGTHTTQERAARVVWYDAAKNVVSVTDNAYLQYSVTSPANAKFAKFHIGQEYGTVYKGDICFSLSDSSRNGTYEPHWESVLELGLGDIKVKSHNLWDEEWEVGAYNDSTGVPVVTNTNLRSKVNNPISVFPNTVYCFTGGSFRVLFYDSEMNFISKVNVSSGHTETTPANCGYIRFYMSSGSGTTYANDLCINLSDPGFNGRYEPYGDGGVISITGGLKSAGTVYDEISGGKLVKRIGEVDLGDMEWISSQTGRVYSNHLSDKLAGDALVCPKYTTYQGTYSWSDAPDKTIGGSYSSTDATRVYLQDTNYTDAASFTQGNAGVPLYYALAQPIEYELADAIPTAMRNDPYGTEERLPEDTAAIVTAPFRADITYATNIKEAVQSLPQNYINVNSMQDFLAALSELMGGTWTMRMADGKFDFTFTPNPSNE